MLSCFYCPCGGAEFGYLQLFYITWDSVGQTSFSAHVFSSLPLPDLKTSLSTRLELLPQLLVSRGCCWFRINPFQISRCFLKPIFSQLQQKSLHFYLVVLLLVFFTLSLPELVPLTLFFFCICTFLTSLHIKLLLLFQKRVLFLPFPTLCFPFSQWVYSFMKYLAVPQPQEENKPETGFLRLI